jgi:hypothetical protein
MHKFLKQSLPVLLLLSAVSLSAEDTTIIIKLPAVPKVEAIVPTVTTIYTNEAGEYKTNEEILQEVSQKKVVKFSNHVAPTIDEIQDATDKVVLVGDVKNGKVPAYLHSEILSVSDIETALEKAGFKILNSFKVDKKGLATSIIFTNDALVKLASKKGRGFAATLRVTIDKKDKLISITNPLYMMAAFMQKEFDKKIAEETLASLRDAFPKLTNSKEELKFNYLHRYQFMAGMPKYQDMVIIKKSTSAKLLASAKKSKKIVFEQKLSNTATLIGVKLGKRTSKFIKKVGYQNAGLLPYPVLIENGEAKILDPKYYIAVMYPMLKMSQFMKIATVPGAINKDIDRIFR